MKVSQVLVAAIFLALAANDASAQLLNKLKQKASQKAEAVLDKKVDKKLGINQPAPASTNTGTTGSGTPGSSNPSNTTGGGLITTPPDVKQNLTDAEAAYKSKNYGQSRYAVQQAMLGVELEIGNKILKSLPATLSKMPKLENEDQVASSGYGWAGLVIARKYNDGKDKQMTVTIANNSVWMSAVNMYMTGAYAQQTGGEQTWKQTTLKGNRGIIEFDKGTGYKLSVPLGQSSLIVFEGVNFATEAAVMGAAGEIDIDGIKKQLGEQ